MGAKSSSGDLKCGEAKALFVDYMEGDLAPEIASRLLSHLEGCSQCRAVFSGIQNVAGLLGHLAEYELPAELRVRPGYGTGRKGIEG